MDVCDRFMEEEVFDDSAMDRTNLVLISASHLANVARNINPEQWKTADLTRPGWRINSDTVSEMVDQVSELANRVNLVNATVVLQLFENSVYMVGGPGGEKRLPGRDRSGTFIVGSLVVANKAAIKDLVNQLTPLFRVLGGSCKVILTLLARYLVAPCCSDPRHVVNYRSAGFLPKLGDAIAVLRDFIRDALFVKKIPNFRVLCPNRMIGVGQRRQEPSDEEAAKSAALWGPDPVHPISAAYCVIADSLETDIWNTEARYTNPARHHPSAKKARYDPSQDRAGWVSGCLAALPRRDSGPQRPARGMAPRGGG